MTTQHPKSPCCGASVHSHSKRRRLCSQCQQSWSLYPHKPGRRLQRHNYQLVKRIILGRETISVQKRYYPKLTEDAIKKRFQQSLSQLVSQPRIYPNFSGRYILIADAMWRKFNRERWTLYLLLLKPRRRNYAYLLDPVLKPGKESMGHWGQVLETLPPALRGRMAAAVTDNLPGLRKLFRQLGLPHQLCHFHLIKELQNRRGKRQAKTLATYPVREQIYQLIRCLLTMPEGYQFLRKQSELWQLAHRPECPRKLSMMGREFLRNLHLYRTYLSYPHYTIPRTTGAAESLVKMIKVRTHSINTPQALLNWSTAFVRFQQTMTCNGSKKTKIPQN